MKGPVCQSCGMPLAKDVPVEGDTTPHDEYCSKCFCNGKFTLEHITAEQMQNFVKGKLKEMRIPGFVASLMVRSIPSLRRWKGSQKLN